MTKTKITLSILTIFTLSGCASFDMSMLNPFSSDEDQITDVEQPIQQDVSEDELQQMYREWQELKPSLMNLANVESEISSLKTQLQTQNSMLSSIQAAQQEMSESMEAKMVKTESMGKVDTTKDMPKGTYSLQIAAASNMKAAQQAWRSQSNKYPRFMKHYKPNYTKFMTKDKEFYRLTIGAFTSQSQAKKNCSSLQSIGGQCIVRAN